MHEYTHYAVDTIKRLYHACTYFNIVYMMINLKKLNLKCNNRDIL